MNPSGKFFLNIIIEIIIIYFILYYYFQKYKIQQQVHIYMLLFM